jgi:hypothetical protein
MTATSYTVLLTTAATRPHHLTCILHACIHVTIYAIHSLICTDDIVRVIEVQCCFHSIFAIGLQMAKIQVVFLCACLEYNSETALLKCVC